jgi:hypothetical protein
VGSCKTVITFVGAAVECLQFLQLRECFVAIVSDSNTVYIDAVLRASKAQHLINQIITNPAEFAPTGRLSLYPYQAEEHDCPLCPDNLCKG